MNNREILQKFDFYRRAPSSLREEIEAVAEHHVLPAGAYYFREGDRCSSVALVGEGSLRVFKLSSAGREVTLYHVREGETCLLSLNSALTGDVCPAHAITESSVEALLLPAVDFRAWMGKDSDLRSFVFSAMAGRLVDLMDLVHEIAFRRMDRRLARFLLQRFGEQASQDSPLVATHEDVAAELGSAREVISRLLKEFERRGAIELARGRILLRDADSLRRLSDRD